MSASEHSKLLTIQPGATANQTNAFLLDRANQTGTQVASTISDFAEAAQDATASLLVAGSNITLVYDDVANTLTISAAGGVTATNLAQGTRTIDTVEITSSTGTSATLTVATTTLAGVMSASDKAKLDNSVASTQDIILDFLEAGTNVTLVHDTNTDKLIISSSGGSATVLLPESQIAFGDSNNEIASSSSLTFDSTVNSLSVGNSGPGAITSGSGETITITGDAGVAINATTGDVAINAGSGSSTITSGVGETITITGDAGVAINATTGDVTINVGSGDSVIEASTGNALSITGDTGMILKTNVNGVVFDLPFAALVTVNDLTSYNNALATNVSGDAFVTKSYADSIGGGAGSVSSVFSRTGAIVADGNDYAAFYATTAQGAKADTALQSSNNISLLNNDANYITLAQVPAATPTDLTTEYNPTYVFVNSSTGTDTTITAATSVQAGVMSNTDKIALDSALQPGDNISDLTNDENYITLAEVPADAVPSVFGRTGAITAEASDYAAFYATTAQGVLADSALQPTSSINALSDVDTATVAPANGQALIWNGTDWAPGTVSSGSTNSRTTYPVKAITVDTNGVLDMSDPDFDAFSVELTQNVTSVILPSYSDVSKSIKYLSYRGNEYTINTGWPTIGKPIAPASTAGTSQSITFASVQGGSTTWTSYQSASTISDIDNLTDVNIVTPADGQLLTYTVTTNTWVNSTPDFATTAQGVLADSALQPNDPISDLDNDAGFITAADIPPDAVLSVFGRTGPITADENDYASFYATTTQGTLADSALQPNNVQVAAGQIAIGSGPGTSEVIGYSSLTYNANSLTIGDNATDGLVINGTAGIMSITALPNNSDITLSPNGAGSVIIDNGSANGKIAANPGETLTVESGADMVISVPAGSVMKVADTAQYDAALVGNSGDALVTKSYADSLLVTYTMDTVQEVTLPNSVNIALGGYLTHTATVANTWDFIVPLIPGKAISWTLELTNGGIDTQNFNSVVWAEGSPPTLKTSGLNILKFTKNNLTGITIGYLAV
jgi:hypothetical protein